jgi:Na+-transporting methylmalonyl-CoA/oxaloacetate decarboxylase beta subunit
MIRTLAFLNLIGALWLAPFVVLGLAAEIAPERTAEFMWSVAGAEKLEPSGECAIIGGADGPTAIFLASRPSGCSIPMLLIFALLIANTIVLWRLRPKAAAAMPAPEDSDAGSN